jgi:hypothetical protein
MSEAEELERNEPYRSESYRMEPGRNDLAGSDLGARSLNAREPMGRPLGSPLPAGSPGKGPLGHGDGQPFRIAPPPGRALSGPTHSESDQPSSAMQWAAGAIKQAMPFVQRLLPLIDGNIAAAVANLLTPHPHNPPAAPKVDLAPLENGLAEIHLQQTDLRGQLMEQNTSLKRVEDQLESVREATDRNTLEQQELIEDLKAVGNKVNIFALLLMGILVISVLLNLVLFLHIQRVLP